MNYRHGFHAGNVADVVKHVVFGRVMIIGIQPRRKLCLALGAASIFFFLILRGFNLYGDPRPWSAPAGP